MKKNGRRRGLRGTVRGIVVMLALVSGAPTVGDIGSCKQPLVVLDETKFFTAKQGIDCQKCTDCGLVTNACKAACGKKLVEVPFPKSCFPLVHDGEVCLRALEASGCSDYADFMADQGAIIPTECDFCPPDKAPKGVGGGGGATASSSSGGG
jgi:hypothetical protein